MSESSEKQTALVAALEDWLRLAHLRYRGGVDTQLNALDADRDLFDAELDLARIRLQETLTLVQRYKARAADGSERADRPGQYLFRSYG